MVCFRRGISRTVLSVTAWAFTQSLISSHSSDSLEVPLPVFLLCSQGSSAFTRAQPRHGHNLPTNPQTNGAIGISCGYRSPLSTPQPTQQLLPLNSICSVHPHWGDQQSHFICRILCSGTFAQECFDETCVLWG